jgi:hypothetical protein
VSARTPPIRWVSRQGGTWNGRAAFEAALDLLEKEPLASLSPKQRPAYLALHAARSLERSTHSSPRRTLPCSAKP